MIVGFTAWADAKIHKLTAVDWQRLRDGAWHDVGGIALLAARDRVLAGLEQNYRDALTFYPHLPADLEVREGLEDCDLVAGMQTHRWELDLVASHGEVGFAPVGKRTVAGAMWHDLRSHGG